MRRRPQVVLILLLAAIGYTAGSSLRAWSHSKGALLGIRETTAHYGLMLDAGSSGSRLHIFKWELNEVLNLQEVVPRDDDEHLFKTHPGLSAYIDNRTGAGLSLLPMIDAARNYIPQAQWRETPLFLKATAGLRMLDASQVESVLDAVREELRNVEQCPFKFVSAEVISGEQEAGLAYISSNYALGALHSGRKPVGSLEMGGASMQVAFRPAGDIHDHEFHFYLDRHREAIYGKSYVRFGVNAAIDRMFASLAARSPAQLEVASPCHMNGFKELRHLSARNVTFIGTGNFSECRMVVHKLLGLDVECLMPPCVIFGTYMPKVNAQFYAFAGFFYAVNGLGLVAWKESKILTPAQIAQATQSFCLKDLEDAVNASGQPVQYAKNYCFLGTYVSEILSALGFALEDTSVTYSRKVWHRDYDKEQSKNSSASSLGWPIGAMLYEMKLLPLELNTDRGMSALCSPAGSSDVQVRSDSHHMWPAASIVRVIALALFGVSSWV